MSYDLHICRPGRAITPEEFRACVAADPDLQLDPLVEAHGFIEAKLPDGQTLRMSSQGRAAWPNLEAPTAWFYFRNGRITMRSPCEAAIDKMRAVARTLDAIVEGDEGERY